MTAERRPTDADERTTTDRETIVTWAEERSLRPTFDADAERPRNRLEFVRREEAGEEYEEQHWEEFFETFETERLALVYREDEPGEDVAHYEFVSRSDISDRAGDESETIGDVESESAEEELLEGETVRTEVVETEVVETEVTEHDVVESEIVESEVVQTETVDSEIVSEEIVGVAVVGDTGRTPIGGEEVLGLDADATIAVEVDEVRAETEEILERKIVESRVVDHEVEEETTVEDRDVAVDTDADADVATETDSDVPAGTDTDAGTSTRSGSATETDVDVDAIQQEVLRSDLVGVDEDLIDVAHVRSELVEGDTVRTELLERTTVERDVSERKVLTADVDDVTSEGTEVIHEEVIETEIVDVGGETEIAGGGATDTSSPSTTSTTDSTASASAASTSDSTSAAGPSTIEVDTEEMGKAVVDQRGEQIGIVSAVEPEDDVIYVDPEPSVADRIRAFLEWGDESDSYPVPTSKIEEITQEEVQIESTDRDTIGGSAEGRSGPPVEGRGESSSQDRDSDEDPLDASTGERGDDADDDRVDTR